VLPAVDSGPAAERRKRDTDGAVGAAVRTTAPYTRSPAHAPDPRIPALDGIRGIAILMVLLLHSVVFGGFTTKGWADAAFNTLAKTGWIGVDLFFVLSGFLITGILADTRADDGYFRTFYVRRALRIVPVYYAFLAVYFASASYWIPPAEQPVLTGQGLAWAASYLSNWPTGLEGWAVLPHPVRQVWSLAIEEQFYILWPLMIYWLPARRVMVVCLAAIFIAWLCRAALLHASMDIASYVWTPARLGPLAFGGFVALGMRDAVLVSYFERWAAPVAITAFAVVLGVLVWRRNLSYSEPATQLIVFDALAVLFGAAIFLTLDRPQAALSRFCSSRWLRVLGKYSYGIYLFHQPIILALYGAGLSATILPEIAGSRWPGALFFALLCTAASLGTAMVSWHLLERHVLRLKDRFAYASRLRFQSVTGSVDLPHRS
jgi:peptidoglycan/LPS O-acetylase OafA/YrhL